MSSALSGSASAGSAESSSMESSEGNRVLFQSVRDLTDVEASSQYCTIGDRGRRGLSTASPQSKETRCKQENWGKQTHGSHEGLEFHSPNYRTMREE